MPKPKFSEKQNISREIFIINVLKVISILFFLYLFLVSIGLMGSALKGFGKGFAEQLIRTTSNPFIGLFVGILTTSIVQSSSTTTSMVVAFTASGVLTIQNAVPIVMGANIGTTVTNILVSLGHINRKEEFRRALGGATIHDFFNIITVIILLPLELSFGILHKLASFMSSFFCNIGGIKITSPIKMATNPPVHLIAGIFRHGFNLHQKLASAIMLTIAVIFLFTALYFLVKIAKGLVINKAKAVLDEAIEGRAVIAMIMGMVFTSIIQSSSVTTSLLVPMVATGILSVENAFPITLGANVGTTVTALLAALAGNIHGLTIAFVHLLFNICGILLIYPYKSIRNIPIKLAKMLANKSVEHKSYAIVFILSLFYILPILLIFIYKILK